MLPELLTQWNGKRYAGEQEENFRKSLHGCKTVVTLVAFYPHRGISAIV
jgi:hypothetical protein